MLDGSDAEPSAKRLGSVVVTVQGHPMPSPSTAQRQCCQPAKISAAKHKSGPRKISAAEFSADLTENGRKGADLFFHT
jgi:hypothetical protein